MSCSKKFAACTEILDSVITQVSAALPYLSDERVLAHGGTFEEFQAAAIARWSNAPVGDESAPESCRTVGTVRLAAA